MPENYRALCDAVEGALPECSVTLGSGIFGEDVRSSHYVTVIPGAELRERMCGPRIVAPEEAAGPVVGHRRCRCCCTPCVALATCCAVAGVILVALFTYVTMLSAQKVL